LFELSGPGRIHSIQIVTLFRNLEPSLDCTNKGSLHYNGHTAFYLLTVMQNQYGNPSCSAHCDR